MAVKEESLKGKEAFLKKAAKYKKSFLKARKVEASTGFETPELDDGAYITKLTSVNFGVTKAGDPYISLNFKIVTGKNKNDRPSIFHNISNDEKLEYLVRDCKRLGIEADDMELEDMIGALEELLADGAEVYVKIDAKNKEWKNPKTKKKESRLNIYINKLLEDYDPDAEAEADDDEDADEGDEDEAEGTASGEDDDDDSDEGDSEESEDADEDDEPEEDVIPEKGNVVKYKPKGSRKALEFTVTKVNTKTETVDLKDDDGKAHKAVPFSAIEIIFSDDEDE